MTPVSDGPPCGQAAKFSGLNWQFQFDPVTSLMTRGVSAPAAPPLVLLLQPAATRLTAATRPANTRKRFMSLVLLDGCVIQRWLGPHEVEHAVRLERGA